MPNRKRPAALIAGAREAAAIAATLGGAIGTERRRLRLTQADLGGRVALSQPRISEIERGLGAGLPLGIWVALGVAIGRPLAVGLSRPLAPAAPADAAHLMMQEFLLRLARTSGRRATFELATRPSDPARSADVGVRDERHRVLILEKAWNTFGDVGAARRATVRKLAEAEGLAIAIGGGRPWRVAGVWVVRASAANRALIRRYPEVFASACPGSSTAWVHALVDGTPPPLESGLVWCDAATGRLVAWRRPRRPRPGAAQTGASMPTGSPNREKS